MKSRKLESYNPRSLPPREAWKKPDRWLGYLSHDQRIELPVDDRNFIQTDNAFDRVMDLFKSSYEWEYHPNDFRTIPDPHHFYYYQNEWQMWSERLATSDNSYEREHATAVTDFRSDPTNIGLMLRGIHNVFHHTTQRPAMPDLEYIVEYMHRRNLAKLAFAKVVDAARGTIDSTNLIHDRQSSVENNPDLLKNIGGTDIFGQEILGDKFTRRYSYLQQSLEEFMSVDSKEILMPDGEMIPIDQTTPLSIIVKLGNRARSFSAIDYRPY